MTYKSGVLLPGFAATSDGTAGAANTTTVAAVAAKTHVIDGFDVSVGTTDTTATFSIQIKSGSTVLYKTYAKAAEVLGTRIGVVFASGIPAATGEAVTLVCSDPGDSAVITANIWGHTHP